MSPAADRLPRQGRDAGRAASQSHSEQRSVSIMAASSCRTIMTCYHRVGALDALGPGKPPTRPSSQLHEPPSGRMRLVRAGSCALANAQATVDVEQILQVKCAGGRHSTADFAAQPPRGNQRDHAIASNKVEVAVRPNEEPLSDDAGKSSRRAADIRAAQNRAKLAGVAGASYGPITSPIPELSGRAPGV